MSRAHHPPHPPCTPTAVGQVVSSGASLRNVHLPQQRGVFGSLRNLGGPRPTTVSRGSSLGTGVLPDSGGGREQQEEAASVRASSCASDSTEVKFGV